MFGSLGRRGYVIPVIMVVFFACMFSFMFYPMTHMEMKGLPFAIVSLDEGAETAAGEINLGETVVDSMTAATEGEDSDDAMIKWTKLSGEDELNEAIDNVDYYGILVVPENYTADTLASQSGASSMLSGADTSDLAALAAGSGMDASDLAALAGQEDVDASQLEALAGEGGADASQLEALAGAEGIDASQLEALAAQGGTDTTDLEALAAEEGVDASQLEALLAGEEGTGTTDISALETGQTGTDTSEAEEVEAPKLTMLLDNAKSPMMANMMRSSISSMFSEMGVDVEVEIIHAGNSTSDDEAEDSSSLSITSMYGTMMGQMLACMPVCMISMTSCMMLANVLNRRKATTKAGAWKTIGQQVLYAVGLSFLVAVVALIMVNLIAGIELPIIAGGIFCWICSFCLMLVFIGLHNISTVLGMVGGMCIVMFGMMCAIMPHEMFPAFWSDFIYPWVPQHFVAEGVRMIQFTGAGAFNADLWPMLIYAAVGVVLLVIGGLIPTRAQKEAKNGVAAQGDDSQGGTGGISQRETVQGGTAGRGSARGEAPQRETVQGGTGGPREAQHEAVHRKVPQGGASTE